MSCYLIVQLKPRHAKKYVLRHGMAINKQHITIVYPTCYKTKYSAKKRVEKEGDSLKIYKDQPILIVQDYEVEKPHGYVFIREVVE